ncbi:hypothetical protein V8C44DRAFT_117084 [Trichoderma aethiopicum]
MCVQCAAILDDPSGALRLVSINHRDAPHLRGSLVSKPTTRTPAITGPDFLWPMSLTPINRGGRPSLTWRRKIAHMHLGVDLWAHQVHPIHSGTRNPGLAFSKGCHPSQSRPAKPRPPSLSRFEHVVSGTCCGRVTEDSVKMAEGTLQRTDIAGSSGSAIPCHPSVAVYAVIFPRRIRHTSWTERTTALEASVTIPVLYGSFTTRAGFAFLSSISPLNGSHVLTARRTLAG